VIATKRSIQNRRGSRSFSVADGASDNGNHGDLSPAIPSRQSRLKNSNFAEKQISEKEEEQLFRENIHEVCFWMNAETIQEKQPSLNVDKDYTTGENGE